MAYRLMNRTFRPRGAFFCCYTEFLQSEAFISTAIVVVMTGVEMSGVNGLGGK